jgi:hypothetical protein
MENSKNARLGNYYLTSRFFDAARTPVSGGKSDVRANIKTASKVRNMFSFFIIYDLNFIYKYSS